LREFIPDSVLVLQHTNISNDPTARICFETVAGRRAAAKKRQCPLLSNTLAATPAATAAVTTAAAKRPLDAAASMAGWDAAADTHGGNRNAEVGDWLDSVHSPPGPSPEQAPEEGADGDVPGLVSSADEDEDPAPASEPAPARDLQPPVPAPAAGASTGRRGRGSPGSHQLSATAASVAATPEAEAAARGRARCVRRRRGSRARGGSSGGVGCVPWPRQLNPTLQPHFLGERPLGPARSTSSLLSAAGAVSSDPSRNC
jgi:hypothetical protein